MSKRKGKKDRVYVRKPVAARLDALAREVAKLRKAVLLLADASHLHTVFGGNAVGPAEEVYAALGEKVSAPS